MTDFHIWQKLTFLRGITALYVLGHHIRNAMWWAVRDVSRTDEPLLYWVNGCVGGFFRFGNLSVLAFFVVSGISIHLATLERNRPFAVVPYLKRRAQRLYPTLIASMVITAACVLVMSPHSLLTEDVFWSAIGTMAFQQTVLVPPFGGNTPYWSLASEGYYYVSYPLLLFLLSKIGRKWLLVGILGGVLTLTLLLPDTHWIVAYYPTWVVGMLIADRVFQGERKDTFLLCLGVMLTIISMVAKVMEARIPWPSQASLQLLGGIGIALLILSFLQPASSDFKLQGIKSWIIKLGDISYSLYATHFPIVSVIDFFMPNKNQSISVSVMASLLAAAASLLTAILVHTFVEAPYLNRSRIERAAAS